MLPFIALYLLMAVILAVAKHFWNGPLFIRTHLKHFPWKLNYSFRWWGVQEYWAAATVLSIFGVLLLALWKGLGGPIDSGLARTILGLVCVASTALSIRHFHLVQKFKDHMWWMTLLTAVTTIALAIVASAYADSFIVNRTRIDAAQFPVAQKALTTLILVSLWAYITTLLMSLAVGVVSLLISITTPSFIDAIKRDPLKASNWKRYKQDKAWSRRSSMRFVVFVGAAFTINILWAYCSYVLEHAEEVIQETLVFSSFHLHPQDCAVPGLSADSWVALVSDKRAVVATPAKRGYTFKTVGCDMQPARVDKHGAA